MLPLLAASLLLSASAFAAEIPAVEPAKLFQQHCMTCHGADRLGGMGPALLPQNLERLKKAEALNVINSGRKATQMPAFGDKLTAAEIQALADYIYTPPTVEPNWQASDIKASRISLAGADKLPAKPVFKADLKNLFIVVEGGDHHATLLDGDKLEPIHRFATRFALHGGPKFSPDGRYVYFGSRDGWISKFDIWNLKTVAEIRAGINTRNVAVSNDGKWVLVGNYLPKTAVLLDADLNLQRIYDITDSAGRSTITQWKKSTRGRSSGTSRSLRLTSSPRLGTSKSWQISANDFVPGGISLQARWGLRLSEKPTPPSVRRPAA